MFVSHNITNSELSFSEEDHANSSANWHW